MPTLTVSNFIPPDRLVLTDGRELTVYFDRHGRKKLVARSSTTSLRATRSSPETGLNRAGWSTSCTSLKSRMTIGLLARAFSAG